MINLERRNTGIWSWLQMFSPSKLGHDRSLQRFVILFFIELSTRKVGIASSPRGLWMNQVGRNLTDPIDGLLNGKRYLIHDRDPLFTSDFLSMLSEGGVDSVKLPPSGPNLNAYAERFIRTIQGIVSGEDDLVRGELCAKSDR